MKKLYLAFLTITACFFASSCSTIQPHPDNKKVRLIYSNELIAISAKTYDCDYLGTLVSSDGHWYSYLFISNMDLSKGALNDMYNKANDINANVVYIEDNIDFATSVTLLGQAYNCTMEDENR